MSSIERDISAELSSLTDCSICRKSFTDPRFLPCFHTFCLKCLEDYETKSKKLKPEDDIPCPVCRSEFKIPNGGLSALEKNVLMEKLIEMTITSKSEAHTAPTDSGSSLSKWVTRKRFRRDICDLHPKESLDSYCYDCEILICELCSIEIHRDHKRADVKKVPYQFSEEQDMEIWDRACYQTLLRSMSLHIYEENKKDIRNLAETVAEIRSRVNMVVAYVQSMQDEVSSLAQKEEKDLENYEEELRQHSIQMKNFLSYCRDSRAEQSARYICLRAQSLLKRSNELFKSLPKRKFSRIQISLKRKHFEEMKNLAKLLDGGFLIGSVEDKTTAPLWIDANVILVGLEVNDGTMNDDVVSVNLFWPTDFINLPKISVELGFGMAAADYNNCVFVTGVGSGANEIWRYDLTSGWSHCAVLESPRLRHCVAFVDEILYACGGYVNSCNEKITLNSVETFSTLTNECKTVGRLIYGVESAGCIACNNSVYVFGGRDDNGTELSCVQVFDTQTKTCTLLSKPMPTPQSTIRAAAWETSVVLLGKSTCFIFDFETDTWQERNHFKTGVQHFGLVIENGRIFVIGGGEYVTDEDGHEMWKCRDDVRFVAVTDVITNNQAVEWKLYSRLPKPACVNAYAKMTLNE